MVRYGALAGLSSSDKYLRVHREQLAAARNRRDKAKTSRKKKKNKKRSGRAASESEDEVPVLHQVNTAEEAPEVEHPNITSMLVVACLFHWNELCLFSGR